MICVVSTCEVDEDKWNETKEAALKLFEHEKETFGHQVHFLRAFTGKGSRVVISGFHDSMGAWEEYGTRLDADSERKKLMDAIPKDAVVPGTWKTEVYWVVE